MSDLTTIARPYAKAAFDFAVEKGQLDQWAEMLTFAAEVTKNEQIHELLNSSMAADKLADIFVAVCGEQFDEYGQNLLKVMAENGRLKALPDVCEQYFVLKTDYEKVVEVDVVSATKLSKQEITEISKKLAVRLERKVTLNCSVDETLLGGVVIRAGDLVIDNSVRGRLNRLSDALQS